MGAPPPTRTARRMSRTSRAASALMRPLPQPQLLAPSRPIGPWVAATMMPPVRRCRHQGREPLLARGIERRGRLVEQPDRPLHREQPRERQPPPLPGREIGRRQIGQSVEADHAQRHVWERRRRRGSAPRTRGSPRPSGRASPRPGGRDSAPARGAQFGAAALDSSRPAATRTRPAIMRSNDDLPAPFRPVTRSACPARQRSRCRRKPRGRRARRRGQRRKAASAAIPAARRRQFAAARAEQSANHIHLVDGAAYHMAVRAKRPYKPRIRRVAPASSADLGSEEKPNPGNA